MLYYYEPTNTYIRDGEGFTLNGNRYPASWDKSSLGLIPVTTVGERENDAYFWVTEETVGSVTTIVNTPKSDEMIATMHKAQVDAKLYKVRDTRETLLNRMAGIALAEADPDTLAVFKSTRLALLDITTNCPTDPKLVDSFISSKYSDIKSLLPLKLYKVFEGVI